MYVYTVLVAHNGFGFDYRILAAEIERRHLMAQFIKADLRFADTLDELRKVIYSRNRQQQYCIFVPIVQMKKANDSALSEWSPEEQRRLSMDSLHRKCFPKEHCYSMLSYINNHTIQICRG